MEKINVFHFEDARDYLAHVYLAKKSANKYYSIQRFAHKLGYKNHTLLSLLLNKTREIRPQHLERIAKVMQLDEQEKSYLFALTNMRAAGLDHEAVKFYKEKITILRKMPAKIIDLDVCELISNWYYLAIIELVGVSGFKEDSTWIASMLKNKIKAVEADRAIRKLLSLGLLSRNQEGKLVKTYQNLDTPTNNGNLSIQEFHRQVLGLAMDAIGEQGIDSRTLNSFFIRLKKDDIKNIFNEIKEFREKLAIRYAKKNNADSIYAISIQAFSLTNFLEDKK